MQWHKPFLFITGQLRKTHSFGLMHHFAHVKKCSWPTSFQVGASHFSQKGHCSKKLLLPIPETTLSGLSEQGTMKTPWFCTCAQHLLITSGSSYFCHAALYRAPALPSLLHSLLATRSIITLILALAKWFLLLLPPGKCSAVQGEMHWAKRWRVLVRRLAEADVCDSLCCQAKPGVPTH